MTTLKVTCPFCKARFKYTHVCYKTPKAWKYSKLGYCITREYIVTISKTTV